MSSSRLGPRVAKVAAVVSSVILVALYINYRSGGQTAFPGSKSMAIRPGRPATPPATAPATTTTNATAPAAATAAGQHLIYSSKFAPVFKPEAFSGSKSAAVFQPADATIVLPRPDALTLHPTTVPIKQAATRAATEPARPYSATTQSASTHTTGFILSNTIGAEFAVAADTCAPPVTQPAGAR